MGIEEFYPMSQPKRLKSVAEMKKLPSANKLVLEAKSNKRDRQEAFTKE